MEKYVQQDECSKNNVNENQKNKNVKMAQPVNKKKKKKSKVWLKWQNVANKLKCTENYNNRNTQPYKVK